MLTTLGELVPEPTASFVAVDTDVVLRVKHIGVDESGTVTVDATTGDVTFKVGVLGAEAVDTTVVASTGVLNVSTTAHNNWGKCVDLINASVNWQAYLVGGLRADVSEVTAGNGNLLVMSETQAHVDGGVALLSDTSNRLAFSLSIGGPNVDGNTGTGRMYGLQNVVVTITNAATTAASMLITCYGVNHRAKTETILYRTTYVTATEKILNKDDWGTDYLWAKAGESILVHAVGGSGGTPTLTVPSLVVGAVWRIMGGGAKNTLYVSDM